MGKNILNPDFVFHFHRKTKTRYILAECSKPETESKRKASNEIYSALPVYKSTGERYIELDRPAMGRSVNKFSMVLSLGTVTINGVKKHRRFTGLPEFPNDTYGDDRNIGRNDGLLFSFPNGGDEIVMYGFIDQSETIEGICYRWKSGELCIG